jgi:CelD/BcsL family acetyltransferase involved in cellulose biosynthesis
VAAEIELFEDLEAVARDARDALDRAKQPCLFSRLDWFRLISAHCPPKGKLLAVRARAGRRRAWLFLSVRHPEASAYSAWYTLRFDAIGRRDEDLMRAIAAALRDGGLARVELAPMVDPEPLRAGFRNAGWITFVTPQTFNWRVKTRAQDFDTFWAKRPARLRNTARRKAKGDPLDLEIHDRFDADAWEAYKAVYRDSWKPEEGSFPFLQALAEQEGAAGTLRLGVARLEGRPVATQLWLVENGEATIHKLAYSEGAKAMSPGTLLGMAMFRRALETDQVKRIDYGTGDEPYKADWMDERRTLWRLTAFNPRTVRGLLGAARAGASALAARWRSR